MTELEVVARTEAEAVQEASAELDIPSSSLEVIEEYDPDDQDVQDFARKHSLAAAPPASDLGVFVIRVSFKHYQEEAQEWTQGLIERFAPGSKAEAIGFRHIIIVRLSVPDPSILIGKNGATLDALQHVVVRALLTIDEKFPDVMLDVERYREKKLIRLEKEARGAADRALRSGRSVALSPMSPAERKFIHNVVKEIDGVKSESRGVEKGRHIVIEPTNPRPQQSRGGPRPGGGGKPYHKDGNRGGGGGGGNRGGGYQGNRPQGGGGGQQGNRQGGQGGGNKGPITEEQRQLLYGKKMAKMESFEDAPIEEKRSFMDYRGGHDAGPAAGGPNKLQDELE